MTVLVSEATALMERVREYRRVLAERDSALDELWRASTAADEARKRSDVAQSEVRRIEREIVLLSSGKSS